MFNMQGGVALEASTVSPNVDIIDDKFCLCLALKTNSSSPQPQFEWAVIANNINYNPMKDINSFVFGNTD